MLNRLKQILLGSPLPTQRLADERLNKIRALAAFSPDALSSIAYANQEIYLGLVVAGSAGLSLSLPIGLVITALLAIVGLSYAQTIQAYPSGGGSYVVARENLGTLPGLVAAAALMIDYVLTAAVSITAGMAAISSAFPALWPYRVPLSLLLLLVITIANLRGLRETGTLMSIPVYLFLATYLILLVVGGVRLWVEGPARLETVAPPATQALTILLVMRAFSSGCTALTGIEAISNGVPAFRPPQVRNASRTLLAMSLLMGLLFVGTVGFTQVLAVVAGPQETILSALAGRLLGRGPAYLIVQLGTLAVLGVAANTSFAGFPRVAAILAQDRFLPHQLTSLGDRLVYANGIVLLAVAAAILMIAFGGDPHALVPLFAVGAFLAFTLSQMGMVVHWRREKGRGWQLKCALNGIGAVATGGTLLVVGVSKFTQGAWLTVLLIPILVVAFLRVRGHYREVAEQLSLSGASVDATVAPEPRLVIPISGVHRGTVDAVTYARSISSDVTGVYVELEPGAGDLLQEKWGRWWPDLPLVVLPSPYRSVIGPLLSFLDESDQQHDDGQLATVVLPEFIPARWWHSLLHNQMAWMIKAALLYRRRRLGYQRAIIDVPYHLRR